jgi:Tol biopolymer transport system component
MSLLDFNESSPKSSGSKKPLKLVLGIGALVGAIALSSTFAASINLNAGGPVEFGQGVVQTTACDSQVEVTPISSFVNSDGGGDFKFSAIMLSELDGTDQAESSEGCAEKAFTIKSYDSYGTQLQPSYLISLGSSGHFFSEDGVVVEENVGTSLSSAILSFSSATISSQSVYRITIESSRAVEKIVYQGWVSGNQYDIFVANSDGSGRTNISNNSAYDSEPDWSPDGKHIVFASDRSGQLQIYKMRVDGTEVTRLTNNSEFDWAPSWSPDGSKIAFAGRRGTNNQMFVMNNDGSNLVQLTSYADTSNSWETDGSPRWSPDGTKIVFWHHDLGEKGRPSEIYVINSDGSELTPITNLSAVSYFPDWSPDGSKIVFSKNFGGIEIYVINSDGSNLNRLTFDAGYKFSPAWSPDGTKIIYDVDVGSENYLYLMNSDGSNQIRLPGGSGVEWRAKWRK